MLKKVVEPRQRLLARGRPAESACISGMIVELTSHKFDHFLLVAGRLPPWNFRRHDIARQLLAIVCIKTPLPADRLRVLVDQHAEPAALQLVKFSHLQTRLVSRIGRERLPRTQKHRRGHFLALEATFGCERNYPVLHGLVFDLEVTECARTVDFQRGFELFLVAAGIGAIESKVSHPVTGPFESVGIGTHRRKKQHDLLLVVLHIGAKPEVFRHENRRARSRWQMLQGEELISENHKHWLASSPESAEHHVIGPS